MEGATPITPSSSKPKESRPEAIVSEYEKNPWAAGWSINFLTKITMVTTLAMKLMEPMMMYKVAKLNGIVCLENLL